jgi:hypothetical protein
VDAAGQLLVDLEILPTELCYRSGPSDSADPFANDVPAFPDSVFLPTVLLACLAVAAVWGSRRHRAA